MPPSKGYLVFAALICGVGLSCCAAIDLQESRNVHGAPSELTQQSTDNSTGGGSRPAGVGDQTFEPYNPDDLQIGCTEISSKRYISDGFCTSTKPISEVVCAGECLPTRMLPYYADYLKVWSRTKTKDWRCVNDVERYKRVHLQCEDGTTRSYRIKTVRSCKCKRYEVPHNTTDNLKKQNNRQRRRRRNRGKNKDNTRGD